jgi:hypothetical protein
VRSNKYVGYMVLLCSQVRSHLALVLPAARGRCSLGICSCPITGTIDEDCFSLKYNTHASTSRIHLRKCDSRLESSQWKCVASSGSSPLPCQQSSRPANQRLTRPSERRNSRFKEPSSQRYKSYVQARSFCTSKVSPTSTIIPPEKGCVAG